MTELLDAGQSDAAKFIRKRHTDLSRSLHNCSTSGIENTIREQLADIWEECREPNWDGYDATAVTWDTYNNTERFLRSLPFGIALPSVGAEPDGHITLDWHVSQRRTLSVSMSPDAELHYAALLGPGRVCGTEPFFGDVPKMILGLIGQVTAC